jgi:uncharacterized protein (DUF433 family)
MNTKTIQIVDNGRGPQVQGSRLTVMDVFYYLHQGHDFDFIKNAMPSLTRDQFDAVVEYVRGHHEELAEEDRQIEERIKRDIAEQKAKGLYRDIDESIPVEERAARLKEKVRRRQREQAEKNGGHSAG